MNDQIKEFIIPIILIVAGILLKKDLLPNTKNTGKLWLICIIVGSISILFKTILIFMRN